MKTKAITSAVKLGVVLVLIMVLGIDTCGGEVIVTIEKKGEGTVTGAGAYGKNLKVPITATPGDGWYFAGWSGGNVDNRNAASTTIITLDENQEITANFAQLQYILAIGIGGGGTVTGNGTSYSDGEKVTITGGGEVTVTATPGDGWYFTGWSGDVDDPTSPITTVTMNGDKIISATFARLPQYPLTVLKQGEGTAYALTGGDNYGGSDAGNYYQGEKVPIGASPAFGWQFYRWEGDNVADPTSELTTVTMDGDTEVTAIFTQIPPPSTPTTMVLDNTEGTFDGYSGHYPGGQFAERFTVEQPSQVVGAEYHITDNPAPFVATLYNADREVIDEVTVSPTGTGWFPVEFPNTPVVEGDFYIGILYISDSAPLIARYSTNPQGRAWVIDPDGTWTLWSEKGPEYGQPDGEFGFRAVVEVPAPLDGGPGSPTTSVDINPGENPWPAYIRRTTL